MEDEGTTLLTGSGGLYSNCYPARDPVSSKLCNSRLTWVTGRCWGDDNRVPVLIRGGNIQAPTTAGYIRSKSLGKFAAHAIGRSSTLILLKEGDKL